MRLTQKEDKSAQFVKVSPPLLPPILERSRLFRQLDQGRTSHYKALWIQGPPGSGKTTLLASYVKARKLRALWYQLDQGDVDPGTWFHYLSVGTQRVLPRFRKPLPHLLPEFLANLPTFARRFFEQLYGRFKESAFLVFDNYHLVPNNSRFQELLIIGIRALPETGLLIILSRDSPPPFLTSLQAEQVMVVWEADQLLATVKETTAILKLQANIRNISSRLAHAFHERTKGWIAGLILLGIRERVETGMKNDGAEETNPLVFSYLGNEVLQRLSPVRIQLLLQTAMFHYFTGMMAHQLTGIEEAKRELEELRRSGYFIETRPGDEPIYQYHPLFREFLLKYGRGLWSIQEHADLRQRAVEILKQVGWEEHALEMVFETGDIEESTHLLLRLAPKFHSQFRIQTLERYLQQLPVRTIDEHPWLQFWLGTCRMFVAPDQSQDIFSGAYRQFQTRGDEVGSLIAWSGVIESIFISRKQFSQISSWLDRLPAHLDQITFPSQEVEVRVSLSIFIAFVWGGLFTDPRLYEWEARLTSTLSLIRDPTQRVMAACHIGVFRSWLGDLHRVQYLINHISEWTQVEPVSPAIEMYFCLLTIVYSWHTGDREKGWTAWNRGMKLLADYGFLWQEEFMFNGALLAIMENNYPKALALFQKFQQSAEQSDGLPGYHYHQLASLLANYDGNFPKASYHAKTALQLSLNFGSSFPEGLCRFILCTAYLAAGNMPHAERELMHLKKLNRHIKSKALAWAGFYVEAQMYEARDQNAEALKAIKNFFALSREQSMVFLLGFSSTILAHLCARALEAGIENDQANYMIKTLWLSPAAPSLTSETWPWPIQVYTLGRFEVCVGSHSISLLHQGRKRLLALLKVLIVLGGQNVPWEKVADSLWPDADGDMAYHALKTTLFRLRKVLQNEEVISFRGGLLTLNLHQCWIDCFYFNELVQQGEEFFRAGNPKKGIEVFVKAFQLYKGYFLPADTAEAWSFLKRLQLHERFQKLTHRLQEYYEEAGQLEQAVDCVQKLREMEVQYEAMPAR